MLVSGGNMTHTSLMTALTLYRSETVTLEGAARYSGVPAANVAVALRARGIPVREEISDSVSTDTVAR
jgi:predicted HTH domain antitoxin